MEYLEGEDLSRLLAREAPLSPMVAIDAVLPVAAGLCEVHKLGIVHRDIKPENILLARDVHGGVAPQLIDFGVSKDLEATVQGLGPVPHTVTGTPHYMSPEQAHGAAQLDGRTDQYALGVLLYQCLTGRLPYESPSLLELIHMIDCGEFRPLRQLRSDLPEALEAAVQRAMSRHPRDRFPSMAAFGRELLPFASERTRLTYDRDFVDSPTLVANAELDTALSAHYVSAATPLGDPFGRNKADPPHSPTTSGVRIRESQLETAPGPVAETRKLTFLVGAFVLVALAFAVLALVLLSRQNTQARPAAQESPSFSVSLSVRPESAAIELDGVVVGHGEFRGTLRTDGHEHVLHVSAPGYEPKSLVFRDQAPNPRALALSKLPVAQPVEPAEPSVNPPTAEPKATTASVKKRTRDKARPAKPSADDIQLSR
jgi:serine/threonine protein kinase